MEGCRNVLYIAQGGCVVFVCVCVCVCVCVWSQILLLMKALSLPHQVLESKNWRGRQEVTVKVRPGPKLGGGVGISIGVEGRI